VLCLPGHEPLSLGTEWVMDRVHMAFTYSGCRSRAAYTTDKLAGDFLCARHSDPRNLNSCVLEQECCAS